MIYAISAIYPRNAENAYYFSAEYAADSLSAADLHLRQFGYHMELLESSSRTVVEEGLKNVHNVPGYPALLVVGQFMEAHEKRQIDPR